MKKHLPFLSNVSFEQLMGAVEEHKVIRCGTSIFLSRLTCFVSFPSSVQNNTPTYLYDPPRLENVLPHLDGTGLNSELTPVSSQDLHEENCINRGQIGRTTSMRASIDRSICFPIHEEHAQNSVVDEALEERLNFIETLRCAYHQQIEQGELEERGGEKIVISFSSIFESLAVVHKRLLSRPSRL